MAEHVSARIRIGGRLPASLLPEFDDASWRSAPDQTGATALDDLAEVEQHIRAGADGVRLFGEEVRDGEFYALQAFCVANGLTYILTYDGCGGNWGPARRRWRPGDEGQGLACALSEDGGQACITADEIAHFRFPDVAAVRAYLKAFDDELTPDLEIVEG